MARLSGWLRRFLAPPQRSRGSNRGALLAQLQGERPGLRWRAAEALSMGDLDADSLSALADTLSDPDPILRWEAGAALARSNSPAARAVLLEALAGPNPVAQAAAADGLRLLTPDNQVAAALLAVLESPNAVVRRSVAEALAGHPMPGGLSALLHLLVTDPDAGVRRAAALALEQLANPLARGPLQARVQDEQEHPMVREAASRALASLNQD